MGPWNTVSAIQYLCTSFSLGRECRQKLVFTWWYSATSSWNSILWHVDDQSQWDLSLTSHRTGSQLSICSQAAVDALLQGCQSTGLSASGGGVSVMFAYQHVEWGWRHIRPSPPGSCPPLRSPHECQNNRTGRNGQPQTRWLESRLCIAWRQETQTMAGETFPPEAASPLGPDQPSGHCDHPLPWHEHCWPCSAGKWGFCRGCLLWPQKQQVLGLHVFATENSAWKEGSGQG